MSDTHWTKSFLAVLFGIEGFVAVTSYLVIALLLLADVFSREVIGTSIWGVQRISVYLMIVTGFLGLGLAAAKGRHLRPRFADGLVPKAFSSVVDRIGSVLMMCVFGGFAIISVRFVHDTYAYGDTARTIGIPLWPIALIVPYSFSSTALRYLIYAIHPSLKPQEILGE